jgi:hypothetical protein
LFFNIVSFLFNTKSNDDLNKEKKNIRLLFSPLVSTYSNITTRILLEVAATKVRSETMYKSILFNSV